MSQQDFLAQLAQLNRTTMHNMRFILESYCISLLELLQTHADDVPHPPTYWQLLEETRNILHTLQTTHTFTKETSNENNQLPTTDTD